jgi:hypothetical protein
MKLSIQRLGLEVGKIRGIGAIFCQRWVILPQPDDEFGMRPWPLHARRRAPSFDTGPAFLQPHLFDTKFTTLLAPAPANGSFRMRPADEHRAWNMFMTSHGRRQPSAASGGPGKLTNSSASSPHHIPVHDQIETAIPGTIERGAVKVA